MIARRIAASSFVAAALAAPTLVFAQDTFQAEAGLSHSEVKAGPARQTAVGPEATFFLGKLPAVPKDYPLEQAQFVERISSLSANFARTSLDLGNSQGTRNGHMSGVSFDFRRPDTPLIASAGTESLYSGNAIDARLYQLSLGAYVDKTTALALDASRTLISTRFFSGGSSFSELTDTFTSIGFSGQHLARLSGGDHVAFIAGISRDTHERVGAAPDRNWSVFVKATYYPTKMIGLRLGVLSDRGDDSLTEGKTYEAGARMFLTPAFSLDFDFSRFYPKARGDSDTSITIKALVRF
jgi:hypothetical protein